MQNDVKILVVDDEERIRRLLRMYLERENYTVIESENGEDALQLALEVDYDLILVDIMMPKMDGLEFCHKLREYKTTPIIIISAIVEENSRVHGFEAGADDYIVKPFSLKEVILRIKALLRRTSSPSFTNNAAISKEIYTFSPLTIDSEAHRVTVNGKEVAVTPKEFELLLFLAKSPGKVFDRERLLKEVWKYEFFGDLRTVDTHIKRLREKLNKTSPDAAKFIVTVWGVGYKFEVVSG
jgi:two-component system, OmpR family, response regulator ResD